MYVVLVDIKVDPDFAAEFRARVLQHAANSLSKEEGCRGFDVSVDPEDAAHFLLYEQYDNRAAFDAHVQTEHFAHFGSTIEDRVRSKELTCWEKCLA